MIAHWIFAEQYLGVVLKLPLLLEDSSSQDCIQRKLKRVNLIVNICKVTFYTMVLASYIVWQIQTIFEPFVERNLDFMDDVN